MRNFVWVVVIALMGFAEANELPPEVVGAWAVPSNYAGLNFAAYTIAADGKVKTELPKVPDDLALHWMDGGTVSRDADGKTYRFRNEAIFRGCELAPDGFGKQCKEARKNGLPFTIDSSSKPAKIVWAIQEPLKSRFPDNPAMPPAEIAKAKNEREDWRFEMEKSPWTVVAAGDCADPSVTGPKVSRGSEKFFEKLATTDSSFRLNRKGPGNLQLQFSGKEGSYFPSSIERSVYVTWEKGGSVERLTLLDQGKDPSKPGVRRFRTNVDGKCKEITASNAPSSTPAKDDGKKSGSIE